MTLRLADDLASLRPTLIRELVDAAPSGAVNLGLGQPVIEPPELLVEVARRALGRAALYTSNAGMLELRKAIARRSGVSPDGVVVTSGAEHALFMAICASTQANDEVLVPDPGFPAYALIARWHGVRVRHYPLAVDEGFDLNVQAVLERVTPRTRLVIINTPSNPTGAQISEAPLHELLAALQARDIGWLSDEVYSTHAVHRPALPSRLSPGRGLVVNSLSKSHAVMGWRLGWLAGPSALIRGLMPLQQMIATCAPVPAQYAALAAMSDAGDEAAEAISTEMRRRREIALEGLEKIPDLPEPTASRSAIYLFVDVAHHMGGDDVALARALLDDGVIVIPGQAFGPRGRGWIRISYGVEPDVLRRGLERLREGLLRLRGDSKPSDAPDAQATPARGDEVDDDQ